MLRKKRFIRRPVARKCFFCQNNLEPSFLEIENLRKFISERGKIISKTWTGVCSKHQRRLGRAIKRARQLSLLPYVVRA